MWWDGKLIPISEVPDTHPNGDPVMKPTLTVEERWVASMYPTDEIDPELRQRIYGDTDD